MSSPIKIGTRASKLALWQAYYVRDLLEAKGLATEIIPIETKGDKILDRSLSKIGSKGVFTEELEQGLRDGSFDIAVHSAKDMQSSLPKDLPIIAFTERERACDVVVSVKGKVDLTGDITIATSSTRRRALVRRFYPNAKLTDVRGNLQTRIQKLRDGVGDVLILAYAGVHRMGYEDLISEELSMQQFVPAVGQGSVAVQASTSMDDNMLKAIRKAVNHRQTEEVLKAERSFLRTLEGGCSIPVFGRAIHTPDGISLTGGVVSLDGEEMLKETVHGTVTNAEKLGRTLAEGLLKRGADDLLAEIKSELKK